ncbi:hypothetical protein CPB83DRAFT_863282 [Crepidotus variabilis]|uniref:Uncharacterized protein n=1 Tax=Crepidotus variabilis TaxID=179855 RepID=A0A9P6E632_9AGAR|nr:hypothetical protein CPB83DRAFT_863282 [Crepidotus variabilis]
MARLLSVANTAPIWMPPSFAVSRGSFRLLVFFAPLFMVIPSRLVECGIERKLGIWCDRSCFKLDRGSNKLDRGCEWRSSTKLEMICFEFKLDRGKTRAVKGGCTE